MKALILNSGVGSRMGVLTSEHPKCMTEISPKETILSRQLRMISEAGIREVVMTTGKFDDVLVRYCESLKLPVKITYVNNPVYDRTNYIYSIYCAREYLDDDILLMHGDLVFENTVLDDVMACETSCMTVSMDAPLPEKDFKAVLEAESPEAAGKNAAASDGSEAAGDNAAASDGSQAAGFRIRKVGIEFFDHAVAAQPLYKLLREDWQVWLERIIAFCKNDRTGCYAENALNEVSDACRVMALDVSGKLCAEIDDPKDLERVSARLSEVENRLVYMCFSTDILHSGHISIIRKAARLGSLVIGVLSDEAVSSFKRFPLLPQEERRTLFENMAGVKSVIIQKTLSYKENLEKLHPAFVVHGDDWVTGFQKPVRDEVISILESYGGKLVEFPYSADAKYSALQDRVRKELSLPDMRRGRLRKILEMKGLAVTMEAHSGLTGLLVENAVVHQDGGAHQFDAMWVSSLCDSTEKGKPDIELVDMTSRMRTIDDLMEVTTKPIIFDGDTGGLKEHFVYTVKTLERMGVSMVIIEDKIGLKKNSLFGTEVSQTQDDIPHFCEKIRAGKEAQRGKEFMICARIESLILEMGMEDALTRAEAYVKAGADAIMIHSRRKDPDEIFTFIENFRRMDQETYLVVVPTSFNSVTEEEWKERGVNVVIYANQLIRAEFPAMRKVADTILTHHRAMEADDMLLPIKEIIRLIPEDY